MLALCNDIWYTSFSHINGFGIRLNPKEKRSDDFIARPGSRFKKGANLLESQKRSMLNFLEEEEQPPQDEEDFS